MAKVVILDDLQETVALLAPPLTGQGHEVLTDVTPIDFERIMRFKPDVITLNLYRSPEAFDRPIRNVAEDVIGFAPLAEMENYPAISIIPIILVGNCLQEKDVPTTIHYDLFISFPSDVKIYFPKVVEIAATVKSRRRISEYVCPNCGSRLSYTQQRSDDLFCPRCHTAVAIVDNQTCIARTSEGNEIPCDLATLRPPQALPGKITD